MEQPNSNRWPGTRCGQFNIRGRDQFVRAFALYGSHGLAKITQGSCFKRRRVCVTRRIFGKNQKRRCSSVFGGNSSIPCTRRRGSHAATRFSGSDGWIRGSSGRRTQSKTVVEGSRRSTINPSTYRDGGGENEDSDIGHTGTTRLSQIAIRPLATWEVTSTRTPVSK